MKEKKINEKLSKHIEKVYQQYGWVARKEKLSEDGDIVLNEQAEGKADE